jgi:carboxymethylenebutenolidase
LRRTPLAERTSGDTPMPDQANYVSLAVADGTAMRAYVARPTGSGPHRAMLVLQEALGVNSQVRGVADRYAEQGYVAIAPELFHRTNPGYEASVIDMDQVMPLVRTLTTEGLTADATAAFNWLATQPGVNGERIAAVGFCMGGRAAYLANAALPLAAAISYYAGGLAGPLLDLAPSLHGPHLFLWGGQDKGIPAEQRSALAAALHAAGKRFVNVEFSDASHAFFNEQVDRYNRAAANQSWALCQAFLNESMGDA